MDAEVLSNLAQKLATSSREFENLDALKSYMETLITRVFEHEMDAACLREKQAAEAMVAGALAQLKNGSNKHARHGYSLQ